jgi:hypothetical protein
MEPEPKQNQPVMDVVAPPPASAENPEQAEQPKGEEAKPADKPEEQAKQPPHEEPSNGVGMAIFATVVVVLSLAALAVYAYLQQ